MDAFDIYRVIQKRHEQGHETSLSDLNIIFISGISGSVNLRRFIKIDTHTLMRAGMIKVQWTHDDIIYIPTNHQV